MTADSINRHSPLLSISNLSTGYPLYKGLLLRQKTGKVQAVSNVSFDVHPGEILGLVGESGCGKSTLARSIVRLIEPDQGSVLLKGTNILDLSAPLLRAIRPQIQMIFQDPSASLDPRFSVFETLAEALQVSSKKPKNVLAAEIAGLLDMTGLSMESARKYPHQFSGGQRQRIAIARALALNPSVIIADEPVSALDVSVQAQILNLLANLCKTMNIAMLFISHDLSVVAHITHRVAVMYLGHIVEIGPANAIFSKPLHPYTHALASAIPIPDPEKEGLRKRILLAGDPPSPVNLPSGCVFRTRCRFAIPHCAEMRPSLTEKDLNSNHSAACIRMHEISL